MSLQPQLSKTSIRKEYSKNLRKSLNGNSTMPKKKSSEIKQKSKVGQMIDFLEKSINLYYSDIETKPENTVKAIYAEVAKRRQIRLDTDKCSQSNPNSQ